MERLSGLDAGFLYMETPTLHMHTLKIAVIDPSTVPGGYSFPRVKEVLAERLHLLPPFRRRLVEVPLGLHHPVWIEDPDFDIDHHVLRTSVPPPGGVAELAAVVSGIASRQLDRGRPLWEVWVLEGLDDGNVGFVAKLHHSIADGVVAAELLTRVLDAAADAPAPPGPAAGGAAAGGAAAGGAAGAGGPAATTAGAEGAAAPAAVAATVWQPEAVPSGWRLVVDALRDRAGQLAGLPGLLRRTAAGLAAVRRRRRSNSAGVSPPLPFQTGSAPFNRAITANRIFTMASLPLDEVKAVRQAFGVTVNDVVLAVCAGALRAHLSARGRLPARPLVAGVPVAVTDTANTGPRLSGNSVSNMFTSLRTDLADPVERLLAIHEVTRAAKEAHQELGAQMLIDWSELSPPGPFAAWMRLYSRLRLADRHRPPINLVVSNVPGPAQPLFIAGARLVAIWSMGPILEGIGLNITVWSYLGQLNFGLVACREAMPDLWDLTAALGPALDELTKASAAAGSAG
jgi:diacylglycerol O-acyltransferase / wax synthase